jgi:hypothetical protein
MATTPTGQVVQVLDENDPDELSTLEAPRMLITVWDDDMITRGKDAKGTPQWRCKWCNLSFLHLNATKALYHLSQMYGANIKKCSARIDEEHKKRYKDLFDSQQKKKKRTIDVANEKDTALDEHLKEAGTSLMESWTRAPKQAKASVSASASTARSEPRTYHQRKIISDAVDPQHESQLTMAIADLIHSCGLPFTLASNHKFKKVLTLARNSSPKFLPPTRNRVAGELLELNYQVYMKKMKEDLLNDADVFGLTFFGDGATVKRMPLINILAAGVHNQSGVLEIVDCTAHVQAGGKKDAVYIANLFLPHLKTFETAKADTVDLVIFDGASNVQKAGDILAVHFPRLTVLHGAEHVVALFYQDLFEMPEFDVLKRFNRSLYRCFGSGAMHLPYAVFQKHSKDHNKGRNIGLIRAADTRMGGHVISLMRTLRLKAPLLSTLTSAEFLQSKNRVRTRMK